MGSALPVVRRQRAKAVRRWRAASSRPAAARADRPAIVAMALRCASPRSPGKRVPGRAVLMDAPEPCAGPMNIGNPAEFTVLELAERVRTLAGHVRRSCSRRRRATIRDSAVPTSRLRCASSIGDRALSSTKDSRARSNISAARCAARNRRSPHLAVTPPMPPRAITPPTSVATTGVKARGRAVRPLHAANRTDVTAGA